MAEQKHYIVGAGIIGLMTAWHLQKRGIRVTLIDRVQPGDSSQASFGNAGILAFASVLPISEPGIIKTGIRQLLSKDPSLNVPLSYWPEIAPWLWKLFKESSYRKFEANARATALLNQFSLQSWHRFLAESKLQNQVRETGWLKLYESDSLFESMKSKLHFLDESKLSYDLLCQSDIQDLEPSISRHFKHGLLQSGSMSIKQPAVLVKLLFNQLKDAGVRFIQADVNSLRQESDGFILSTGQLPIKASSLTIASGAWSQRLLRTLGSDFPLETERGYHLMFDMDSGLSRPVMDVDNEVILCPMSQGLRITAGEELAGLDAPPNYAIIERKLKAARELLPNASWAEQSRWLGFRPSLPDSKPIIGMHPEIQNLYLAFGHGHLGMTQSAATGLLMSQIICGDTIEFDLKPFAAKRF